MLDNILRAMIEVGNNSRLTQQVAISLEDKLSPEEMRDFMEWLKSVMSLAKKTKPGSADLKESEPEYHIYDLDMWKLKEII
jgi:hypothetical protein